MAHQNKVMRSIETPDGGRCVDIFERPGHTFGFEEYRLDVEDPRGWFPIGAYGTRVFASESAALTEAFAAIPWLGDVMPAG